MPQLQWCFATYGHTAKLSKVRIAEQASINGHSHILLWMWDTGLLTDGRRHAITWRCIDGAAIGGHLHILRSKLPSIYSLSRCLECPAHELQCNASQQLEMHLLSSF